MSTFSDAQRALFNFKRADQDTADSMYAEAKSLFGLNLDNESEIEIYKIWDQTPSIDASTGFFGIDAGFSYALKAEQISFTPKTGTELFDAIVDSGEYAGDPRMEGVLGAYLVDDAGIAGVNAYLTGLGYSISFEIGGSVWQEMLDSMIREQTLKNPSLSDGVAYGDSPHMTDTYSAAETYLYASENGYPDHHGACIMEYAAITDFRDMSLSAMGTEDGTGAYDIASGLESLDLIGLGIGGAVTTTTGLYAATDNIALSDRTCFLLQSPEGSPNVAWKYPVLAANPVDGTPIGAAGDPDKLAMEFTTVNHQGPGRSTPFSDSLKEHWVTPASALGNCNDYIRLQTAAVSNAVTTMMDTQFLQAKQRSTSLANNQLSALVSGAQTVSDTTFTRNTQEASTADVLEMLEDY